MSNMIYTDPNPAGKQLGELFGTMIPDHQTDSWYEVVVHQPDGSKLTFTFVPDHDERIGLQSACETGPDQFPPACPRFPIRMSGGSDLADLGPTKKGL